MTLIWRPGYMPLDDPDAADYIAAVEAADELASPGIGALEDEVKAAIHAFVKGCKNDGIWPAIKASCILAGARTLNGALVPLVGTAPTNYNFVAGDYNRETGLVGDGSTKYLDSGYSDSSAPLSNNHQCCFSTSAPTADTTRYYFSVPGGATDIRVTSAAALLFRNRNTSSSSQVDQAGATGFLGTSRSSAANFTIRLNGANVTATYSATIQDPDNYLILQTSNARISFYSIGESLDLAALDGRVTDLMTAIGAAIP